jgi:hypothetical protein
MCGFIYATLDPIMLIVKIFDNKDPSYKAYYHLIVIGGNKYKPIYKVVLTSVWIFLWQPITYLTFIVFTCLVFKKKLM